MSKVGFNMKEKKIYIVDVAKHAGVSIATVSRIINNLDYPVSEETKSKVLKAIEELSYRPNKAAQGLRKSSNEIIGLIVRDISDSYFGLVAKGVSDRASELGFLSFVCNTGRNPEDELRYHDLLWQYRVKGIILAGGGLDQAKYKKKLSQQLERHERFGLNIVTLAPQGIDIPYVMIDNVAAGRKVVEYLIERGHKKIGIIGGPKKVLTTIERMKGHKIALEAANIKLPDEYITYCDFSQKGGYEACKYDLLAKVKDITAICCQNDNIAIGAMTAIKELGLKVPDDISIIGIGDLTESDYADPPLTTLSIPFYELGRMAVDVIVSGKDNIGITVDTAIIERKSVKTIK